MGARMQIWSNYIPIYFDEPLTLFYNPKTTNLGSLSFKE